MRDFGFTIWFTGGLYHHPGLPSSGKTTLGQAIQSRFKDLKIQSVLLDGDVLRKGLNKDLDFSPESRLENNRRVAEVAKLFAQNGTVSIVTFISPYKVVRIVHQSRSEKRPDYFTIKKTCHSWRFISKQP
ncbi:Adenylyl-sulfate kinase [Thelohanellus kitauei]|uniref:Adenylyl-sulfate kinase n=1 Tax=Thelohanellus kitauei TaxID=669202 RepID=A0A0C2IAR1_THEKT|nr:Adenylyl-sulfate kinase [Thelohanellus kitauei]